MIVPLPVIHRILSKCCIDIRMSFRVYGKINVWDIQRPPIEQSVQNSTYIYFIHLVINSTKKYTLTKRFNKNDDYLMSINVHIYNDGAFNTYFNYSDYHYIHTTLTIQGLDYW